jgi:hypothetical protein
LNPEKSKPRKPSKIWRAYIIIGLVGLMPVGGALYYYQDPEYRGFILGAGTVVSAFVIWIVLAGAKRQKARYVEAGLIVAALACLTCGGVSLHHEPQERGLLFGAGTGLILFAFWVAILSTKVDNARRNAGEVHQGLVLGTLAVPFVLGITAGILWDHISCAKAYQEEIAVVTGVTNLIDTCKSMGSSVPLAIKGKALVWDVRSSPKYGANFKLPIELAAFSSNSPITVFMIVDERKVQVGTYSVSHEPANREYVDIAVAYWPDKTPVGIFSVLSSEPPSSREVQYRPGFGDSSAPIIDWIEALARTK